MMLIFYFFLAWLVWIAGIPLIKTVLKFSGSLNKEVVSAVPHRLVLSWGLICLSGLLFLGILNACSEPENSSYITEISQFRAEINTEFADTASSPLTEEGLTHFDGLAFFPPDEKYRVEAKFIRNPDPQSFEMETTTERRPVYVKYGEAHFLLDGKKYMLEIYQSEKAKMIKEFKEHLFLPFKDLTNGIESYGGGRFIDLKIPEGNILIIDFNKAYNPYCAYNHKYSCPIPPRVNHLNIEIPAGVKGYEH